VAALPFASIVDTVLPILENRAFVPVLCCSKCRTTWSAALSARLTHPDTWMNCPNRCDDRREQEECGFHASTEQICNGRGLARGFSVEGECECQK
jgi:hypothetical protein